jgi:hypothetical protein
MGETMKRHIAGLAEGGCTVAFRATDIESGAPLGAATGTGAAAADRFVLVVPVAGRQVRWHIVYDAREPGRAPDVIFADSDDPETNDPCAHFADLARLATLGPAGWNAADPRALQRAALEILALLRARHRDTAIALMPERVRGEFAAVVVADGAEVLVERPAADVPLRIHAALPLLPPDTLSPDEPGRLLLSFTPARPDTAADARVVLPPRMLQSVGGRAPAKLPVFYPTTSLAEYVARVADSIKAPMEAVAARQRLFQALRKVFGSPLEFDPPLCTTIWFAFEDPADKDKDKDKDKPAVPTLLRITATDGFPTEPPGLMLQSGIYHKQGRPYQLPRRDFPYSPRWPPEELAQRLATYVKDNIREFNTQCSSAAAADDRARDRTWPSII